MKIISLLIIWFIISVAVVLFDNCSTDKSIDEFEEIKAAESLDDADISSVLTGEKSKWPYYRNNYSEWTVKYKLYTNFNHPKGYVIITEIKKSIDVMDELWIIDYNASNYIEEIHYNLKATHKSGATYEENNVFLPTDDKFRVAFRTAEAIYIAWIAQNKVNPVRESSIKEAKKRMEGRPVGIMME